MYSRSSRSRSLPSTGYSAVSQSERGCTTKGPYPPLTSTWFTGVGASIQRTHSSRSCHWQGCAPFTSGAVPSQRMRTASPGAMSRGSRTRGFSQVCITVSLTAPSFTPASASSVRPATQGTAPQLA